MKSASPPRATLLLCGVGTAAAVSGLHQLCATLQSSRPTVHFTLLPVGLCFRYRGVNKLEDMLRHAGHSVDAMYYETLVMSLQQLEQLKSLKVDY